MLGSMSTSSTSTPIPASDQVRRFIVENRPVRGHFVRIESAWRALREHQQYPAPVRELLGQAVSAAVLLAATLKFRGTLTLQLQGHGAARLLVAQCTHDFRVRAVVRTDERAVSELPQSDETQPAPGLTPAGFRALVGSAGKLAVTIEASEGGARYQGIVPLEGESLAQSLETYFASSEQLPTRIRLAADDAHAAGLLIQKLPSREGPSAESQDAWHEAEQGLGGVQLAELLELPLERVLARNFGQRDLRLFAGTPVRFECRCGPERVQSVLRALGEDQVRDVLREQGSVTVTCDFCSRPYHFDALGVEALFAGAARPPPHSLH